MRISKSIAQDIAKKALKSHEAKIEKAEDSLIKYVDELGGRFTPTEVKDMAKKHPGYFTFKTLVYIWVVDGQTPWKRYKVSKSVPLQGDYGVIYVDEAAFKGLEKLDGKVKNLKGKLRTDTEALVIALVQLGTAKRVKAELPELEKFLPTETSTTLVPNMDHIRKIIAL